MFLSLKIEKLNYHYIFQLLTCKQTQVDIPTQKPFEKRQKFSSISVEKTSHNLLQQLKNLVQICFNHLQTKFRFGQRMETSS